MHPAKEEEESGQEVETAISRTREVRVRGVSKIPLLVIALTNALKGTIHLCDVHIGPLVIVITAQHAQIPFQQILGDSE